jgi:hypothetical protein
VTTIVGIGVGVLLALILLILIALYIRHRMSSDEEKIGEESIEEPTELFFGSCMFDNERELSADYENPMCESSGFSGDFTSQADEAGVL